MKTSGLLGPGSSRWSTVAFVASLLMLAVLGFFYTNHVQRQSEQKWCEVVSTMDSAYRSNPPQTELGRKIAADMAKLRRDLGC